MMPSAQGRNVVSFTNEMQDEAQGASLQAFCRFSIKWILSVLDILMVVFINDSRKFSNLRNS
jgi:hypothetical protein